MNKSKQTDAGRIRHSITSRLNRKMFFRLCGLFVSLNIIICIIAGIGLWIYCEQRIATVTKALNENEPPDDGGWLNLSGMSIYRTTNEYNNNHYPVGWPFRAIAESSPHWDQIYYRGFRIKNSGFEGSLRSIEYVVAVRYDDIRGGVMYEIALNIGSFVFIFVCCMVVLCAYQLVSLLSRTIRNRSMVRKTLDPIAELARAAQTLNAVNIQLDHEKMMALAGRLDGIDAGRLDTRIQIDDLHEELRNVAIAINGMLDRIYDAYAAQSRFVSDASHELRTPIAVIQGYANLLDRWGKEDEKALTESVSAIKDEAENMKGLIEQLLFLARGDSNRIQISQERIDMAELIDEVVMEARMLSEDLEFIVLESDVAALADRSLIKQSLRILVDNAVKYTDPGGEITLSALRDGDTARISVTDTGIGIPADVLPRVFDRFVRADESRTRATGGAGLGLSIAKWIAARHDGHLEVISREGIGTRFTLVLPAAVQTDE